MAEPASYEIVETRYQPKTKRTLDFSGTLDEAQEKATEEARKNIGVRYAVFRKGGMVAEFQAYYRTSVVCPKCGEVIPID